MTYTIFILVILLTITNAKPIEKDYGTDEKLSIKLQESSENEDKLKDIVKAKDIIDESEKPSVDEKSLNKRVEVAEGSADEAASGDAPTGGKEDVKAVASVKVEEGEKRDEFERGLIDDSAPSGDAEGEKRSHKSKHETKAGAKKRCCTLNNGGWWNCCNQPCHHVEHVQAHHDCAQAHHEQGACCHGQHAKGAEHEHHDAHHQKEHGFEMYEEWGEQAGKAHGQEGHHACCHEGHRGHECEQVRDCGHKECCHQEVHQQPCGCQCCHPNCCEVCVQSAPCPCCGTGANGVGGVGALGGVGGAGCAGGVGCAGGIVGK